MSTAPTPTPQKTGTWLRWILGFAGVALLLLVVGGLVLTGLFVRGVGVNPRDQQVEVRTPVGDFSVSSTPARDVGLPIYPGATLVEKGANVELGLPEDQRVGITAVHYRSSDRLDKVDAWYRGRLGPEFKRETGDKEVKITVPRGHATVREAKTEGVAYVAEDHDVVQVVAIEAKARGVEIALLRIGKRETQ